MSRRKHSLFTSLVQLPWWMGLIAAAIFYFAFSVAIPAYLSQHKILAGAGQALRQLAPLAAFVCLAAAAVSAIRAVFVARKFDAQRGLGDLRTLRWSQFESIVGEAFRRQGYSVKETGGAGADGGIDIVLTRGRERYFVQCKHWRVFKVGVKVVRELNGVIAASAASGGFVVTTGAFTEEARRFVAGTSIELIDGRAFEQLCRRSQPRTHEHNEDWADSETSKAITVPACPRCGDSMVKRVAQRGQNVGSEFWGCSRFPDCRGTRP